MKNLHTISTTKYAEALKSVFKAIESNDFNRVKFLHDLKLPCRFIEACTRLNFLGRCCNGKYTVALHEEVKDLHGRMISLEIVHIEKIRKMKFKAKNKES